MSTRGSYRPLDIAGVHLFEPVIHGDARGSFHEWFKADAFAEALGHPLIPEQANMSVSAAGVLRGLHYADVPPGQAKLVCCPAGRVADVVVDLRRGSPTFLEHLVVELDDVDRRVLYLPVGVGHGFAARAEGSVVCYLTSTAWDPAAEHAVSMADPALGLDLPALLEGREPVLSDKDRAAPALAEVRESLPDYADCRAAEAELRDLWAAANGEAGR